MKRIVLLSAVSLSLIVVTAISRRTDTGASPGFGGFSGTSPCDDFVKPFLRIPTGEKCDRIKWQLTLQEDPISHAPTTYKLTREFGYHVDNRTYQSKGTTTFEGTWKVAKGGNVFQLDADRPHSFAFLQLDQNILHPLDAKNNLLAGNSAHSYTLNREELITKQSELRVHQVNHTPETNLTTAVTFTGRTPCRELAQEIKTTVTSDCAKLKWSLTLYRDPKTLAPTTYQLRSTLTEHQPREGKWKVVRGPNTIVYEIDGGALGAPLFLLKGDDGVLFFVTSDGSFLIGNGDFSYTLNRVSRQVGQG
jgi:hypothetical protein